MLNVRSMLAYLHMVDILAIEVKFVVIFNHLHYKWSYMKSYISSPKQL